MAKADKAGVAVGAHHGDSEAGKTSSPRMALAIGLALGSVLTQLVQPAISALPARDEGGMKDETRIAAGASSSTHPADCTALAQDLLTGVTVAVDCGEALPPRRPARRAAAIES